MLSPEVGEVHAPAEVHVGGGAHTYMRGLLAIARAMRYRSDMPAEGAGTDEMP